MEVNRRLLLFLCFVSLVKCEPRCSRFEYEEKLLEKMVRLEFDVSQMLKETQNLAIAVNEELLKMRKDVGDVESRVAAGLIDLKQDRVEFKENLDKNRIELTENSRELKENVSSAIGLMQRFSEQLNDTMEIYRNTTTRRLEDLSVTPLVAFRAFGIADSSPATNQIIVYPDVQQNYGNGYDSTTGIFTAPVAGLYLFSVQAMVHTGTYFYYDIVKGDYMALVYGRAYEDSGHPSTSSTTVAYLNVGEKVWVKCTIGSAGSVIYSPSYNQFLGILIHR